MSYYALCGSGNEKGDGIIPLTTASLTGAENVVIEGRCYHANFLPGVTTAIVKEDLPWYGSPHILKQWAKYI